MQRTNYFTWFILLNKRIFCQKTFLLLLFFLPLMSLAFRTFSESDSGALRIGLVLNEEEKPDKEFTDDLPLEIISTLLDKKSIIRFYHPDSMHDAYARMEKGQLDAVWIFPADLEQRILIYPKKQKNLISVIEKENHTMLRLSRELLFQELYPHISYALYLDFMEELPKQLPEKILPPTKDILFSYYDSVQVDGELLQYRTMDFDGRIYSDDSGQADFLLTPLRGFITIWLFICALLCSVYYRLDEQRGVLTWIPLKNRSKTALWYQLSMMFPCTLVACISLYLLGLWTFSLEEIGNILLFCLSCILFADLLRMLLKNITAMVFSIPILAIFSLLTGAIFFDLHIPVLPNLLPTSYYLRYRLFSAPYIFVYILILIFLRWIFSIVQKKK